MSETLVYPQGSIISLVSGEYSDFTLDAIVVTLKECNLPVLGEQFRADFKPDYEGDRPRPEGFAGWLIANGHCMPVEASQVHTGSYGGFSLGETNV